jgi:tetratricopeptide (TPR) repeat protein
MSQSGQQYSSLGEKAYKAGQYMQAADNYAEAERQFAAVGDPMKAAEMANNRSVALLQAGRPEDAFNAADKTDAVFAQGNDTYRQALSIGNQAAALEALNRPEEALKRYWECSNLLKQIGEKEYRAAVLKSISALQVRTGHQFEALASMDAALENQKKLSIQERFLKKLLDIPMRMLRGRK